MTTTSAGPNPTASTPVAARQDIRHDAGVAARLRHLFTRAAGGTTIVTFLMVFLIQNTQNRDAKALHLKLDELIRAVAEALNEVIDVEEETDDELSLLQNQYRTLHQQARAENTQ